MKIKNALKAILILSIAGVLFSGYLSYSELFMKTCPLGGCTNVINIPACVYGLVMYLAVLILSVIGLRAKE